ncbi:transglycosylase domain-containing protein [Pseudaeromonas sharmana]|uniref:Transglycosylase domain-containing protein n=1 Tax=Pseudaeromonas sharmana TaxID=328412 RepID=A0ABV8CJV7_9GAMM
MDAVDPHASAGATASAPAASAAESTSPPSAKRQPAPVRTRVSWFRRLVRTLLLTLLIVATAALVFEMRTSWLQAHLLTPYARGLTWQLESGPSTRIHFPAAGPYDARMGYAGLPGYIQRLQQRGFDIAAQSHFSPALYQYTQYGLFPPYPEKSQAGLTLYDCRREPIHVSRYPQHQIFEESAIPALALNALLYIENRDLLDNRFPLVNPAVDWPRFFNAALSQASKKFGVQDHGSGGSTLATQMEKFRHSPEGRTSSGEEKLRQMASASIRAYQQGQLTLGARHKLALDYLNSVPLAAAPGYGEVHGLGDGLHVWFAADVADTLALLALPDPQDNAEIRDRQGLALRQVVSLLIAHRRPTFYLLSGRDELASLTDSYLRLLSQEQFISMPLRDAALHAKLTFRNFKTEPAYTRIDGNKARYVTRGRLGQMLGLSLYDLDHLDLAVQSQLDNRLQQQVSDYLRHLADPDFAGQIGLYGERLLSAEKTAEVRYSFTLFERTAQGFVVRVQTDNTDQPFDINDSSKLELGSTAKLRVLTTYLQMVHELHGKYALLSREELRQQEVDPQDNLSRWAIDYLTRAADRSLTLMLDAALDRRYSASPYEGFFTGGGLHTFANFRKEDNNRIPTLRQALQESINLPFIRLLRDEVRYTLYQDPHRRLLLQDDKDPRRQEYLARFADREGKTYLSRFWRKYQGKSAEERLSTLLDGLKLNQSRLAAIYRFLSPQGSPEQLATFIRTYQPQVPLTTTRLDYLYQTYGPGKFSLPDQGYVARVHPLELWLLDYLNHHPDASFADIVHDSSVERQEVYGWLFKSRHRSARDSRIRTMLEIEAFSDIHLRWQQLGYPFDHLVPSLATAIGSSGDRPAALAELMGIILNDGIRQPVRRLSWLHFAADTPYESLLVPAQNQAQRVLPLEVAQALRAALSQVVEAGTARRIAGTFTLPDGTPLKMGGKTGTGDNRIEKVGRYGQIITSKAMNRTATFVFYLGEQHFGTLTAYVEGSSADNFRFTSALPVQVLKGMAPLLMPYLQPPTATPVSGLGCTAQMAQLPRDLTRLPLPPQPAH